MLHDKKQFEAKQKTPTHCKESITFDFENSDTKLIINANFQHKLYSCTRHPVPEISFDIIQSKLELNDFTFGDCNDKTLEIKISGFYHLTFKHNDAATVVQLQKTTKSLKQELDREKQKNSKLEAIVISQEQKINSILQKLSSFQNGHIQRLTDQFNNLQQEVSEQKLKQKKNWKQFKVFKNNLSGENVTITSLADQLTELQEKIDEIGNHAFSMSTSMIEEHQLFHESKIVCSLEQKRIISNFFNRSINNVELLYRASDNNYSTKKFHKKCDGIGNTLTVIWTQFNKKIGGYSEVQCRSSRVCQFLPEDREEFLFSLSHNDKFNRKQISQHTQPMQNNQGYGPRFGGGWDLTICDKAKCEQNWAYIGTCFENQNYRQNNMNSWVRFHGDQEGYHSFKVKEWEVWRVDFGEENELGEENEFGEENEENEENDGIGIY